MTPSQKIKKILEIFGMKASVAAKAMGVTENTFGKKSSEKESASNHSFNEKNFLDLKKYIVEQSKKLENET